MIISKVDKKFRDKTFGLGKSTFSCFLCNASTQQSKDPEMIRNGFRINRTLADIRKKAELLRCFNLYIFQFNFNFLFFRINPEKKSKTELGRIGQGVSSEPIMKVEFDDMVFTLI